MYHDLPCAILVAWSPSPWCVIGCRGFGSLVRVTLLVAGADLHDSRFDASSLLSLVETRVSSVHAGRAVLSVTRASCVAALCGSLYRASSIIVSTTQCVRPRPLRCCESVARPRVARSDPCSVRTGPRLSTRTPRGGGTAPRGLPSEQTARKSTFAEFYGCASKVGP